MFVSAVSGANFYLIKKPVLTENSMLSLKPFPDFSFPISLMKETLNPFL